MSSLYDLSRELALINDQLSEANGELTPEMEQALATLKASLPKKEESWVRWYRNVKAEDVALDMEIERLTKKRTARRKLMDWIKTAFHWHMEQHGLTKIETSLGPVRLVENSQKKLEHTLPKIAENMEYPSMSQLGIADLYDCIPLHYELNEDRLKSELEKGREITGCKLVRGRHIRGL